jgi:probable phosphoglycerate mutase
MTETNTAMGAGETSVTIMRHGESVWNLSGRHQGQLDSPLSERGVWQARRAARWLARRPAGYDTLYSSDLGRAVRTAEVIAAELGLGIVLDVRLRERKLGILEGLTLEDFEMQNPYEYRLFVSGDPDYVIPSGESVRERFERAVACLIEIAAKHRGRSILVVTHGGVLDSIFRKVCCIGLHVRRNFSIVNAGINIFMVSGERWKLMTWGSVSHLGKEAAHDDA